VVNIPDALIHSLLSAGLSFREISRIAKCSHGSVSAAKKEWLAQQALAKANEEKKKSESIPVVEITNQSQTSLSPAVEPL
jgi:hypothetical protein